MYIDFAIVLLSKFRIPTDCHCCSCALWRSMSSSGDCTRYTLLCTDETLSSLDDSWEGNAEKVKLPKCCITPPNQKKELEQGDDCSENPFFFATPPSTPTIARVIKTPPMLKQSDGAQRAMEKGRKKRRVQKSLFAPPSLARKIAADEYWDDTTEFAVEYSTRDEDDFSDNTARHSAKLNTVY